MDLQKEFSDERERRVIEELTETDHTKGKEFLDNVIVANLRKQKDEKPWLNYYCITFYHVHDICRVICNIDASMVLNRELQDNCEYKSVMPSTLIAAGIEAKKYNIIPIIFDTYDTVGRYTTAYRFELRLF